jgi:hypothetical protein
VVSSPRRRAQNLGVQYLRLTHRLGWSTLNGRRTAPSTTRSTPHRTFTTIFGRSNSHNHPAFSRTTAIHIYTMVCRRLPSRNHMPRALRLRWLVGSCLPPYGSRATMATATATQTESPLAQLCHHTTHATAPVSALTSQSHPPRHLTFQTQHTDSNG